MRTHITCFALLLVTASFGQPKEVEMGLNLAVSAPTGSMRENMSVAGGLNLNFYVTPASSKYAVGLEFSANGYGYNQTSQTYTFSDGSTAPMDIVVSNNFYNIMLGGRHFFAQGKIQPFITGKVGYSIYSTRLNIYDPDELDHCKPVDTDVLKRDGTVIFAVGGGIRWDMLPRKNPNRFFLNASVNYTSGGNVDYMNVNAPNHNHSTHTSDVYAKFMDTQTQIVHEHHVGNVYTSLVEQIDFRFGVTMKLFSATN